MTVLIDLAAIAHNAALIRERVRVSGLGVTAVVKEPFATPAIVDAVRSGGIDALAFSAASLAKAPPCQEYPRRELISLIVPEQAPGAVQQMDASLHTCTETVAACATAADAMQIDHGIWIGVRTTDDREGVGAGELLDQFTRWTSSLGKRLALRGLLAHWGCQFEVPPTARDIKAILKLAEECGRRLAQSPLPVSLGGSVLLPMLDQLPVPPGNQLRVGEAILTGAIPGDDAHGLDLRQPFTIDAHVVEASIRSDADALQHRILIDRGASMIDHRDLKPLDVPGKAVWSSSDMTAIDLADPRHLPRVGDTLTFSIGYRSALRALSNPAVKRREITRMLPRDARSSAAVHVDKQLMS